MESASIAAAIESVLRVGAQRSGGAQGSGFKNNYFAERCSGSEEGSYFRLIDFVYHSTLDLRVIKRREEARLPHSQPRHPRRAVSQLSVMHSVRSSL